MVTEKMSVHDAREIRAMGQQNGIDIFGANSLGVADAWNQVRIGGALGGDTPAEALLERARSRSFQLRQLHHDDRHYLRMAGWGTTTLISSGKDVYIHYAAPEFASRWPTTRAARPRCCIASRAATTSTSRVDKPVVACVVGRWKAKLTRAVGHAGAMAGGGDDAAAKERWFMEKFGVDGLFTPNTRSARPRALWSTNIAHIPQALTAVMRENATRPDFAPGRQSRAQALVRLQPGADAASGARPAGGRGAGALRRADRALSEQVGAVFAAPVDEGRLGRLADGRRRRR